MVQKKLGPTGTLRRSQLDLNTPAELAVFHVLQVVESLGAHPMLTQASIKLLEARELLADWVDSDCPGAYDDPCVPNTCAVLKVSQGRCFHGTPGCIVDHLHHMRGK